MSEVTLTKEICLAWYSKKEVQQTIIANALNREVAVKYGTKGFGKRPDILKYPQDIVSFVQDGATSFHISEEIWSNVQQINPGLRRQELDQLRKGWDLVIDIDCAFLEYSKIAAHHLVQSLRYFGIQSFSVKFSGNHGFHIAVPFDAFPLTVSNKTTKELFPEAPRRIAFYLKDFMQNKLAESMLQQEDINTIVKKTAKPFTELVKQGKFDPYAVISIDTILLSSRHLYRSIYSLNEKSGLLSVPVDPEQILSFDKAIASPENYLPKIVDFVAKKPKKDEAKKLLIQAFDYVPKEEKPKELEIKEVESLQEAIPESLFPPCIKLILQGMDDGKKRALFILVNFLTSAGWSYDLIEARLKEWNQKNKEPLRDTILLGHIRYHKQNKKRILPPNCQNVMYYTDLRVCNPDNFCARIRNPASYSLRQSQIMSRQNKPKKQKKEEKGKS